jgi:hypothetical protein
MPMLGSSILRYKQPEVLGDDRLAQQALMAPPCAAQSQQAGAAVLLCHFLALTEPTNDRHAMMTVAPCCSSALVVSQPVPELAPVTMAVLSRSVGG